MKIIPILALGAAALVATPAMAKPGNGHGHGNDREWQDRDSSYRYGHDGYRSAYRNCPPGLAKKHNGCLPPGQARRMWSQGQRIPNGYGYYTPYNQIPQRYVDQYGLTRDNRYIYRDGTIYQVNPRTSIVEQILGGLIR